MASMFGGKTGAATHIKESESRAHLIHCHVHALQLAVDNTIKAIEINERDSWRSIEIEQSYEVLHDFKIVEKKSNTLQKRKELWVGWGKTLHKEILATEPYARIVELPEGYRYKAL